jgi:hypothetical protein
MKKFHQKYLLWVALPSYGHVSRVNGRTYCYLLFRKSMDRVCCCPYFDSDGNQVDFNVAKGTEVRCPSYM